MPILHAVVLALVQAATEFLPVSSTAHLVLVPWLLGWPAHSLLFDIALHLGTVVAVMVYFFRTWVRLAFLAVGKQVWKPAPGDPDHDLYENPRLFLFLVLATLPAGIAGLLFKDAIETVLRGPLVIAAMLIVVALVLWWAEKAGSFKRDLSKLSLRDAMLIGCAQAAALVPGTSRSGATISTGMFLGLSRHAAARFSFLLSTPVILGAGLKAALDAAGEGGIPADERLPLAVGFIVAAVSGYAVISLFLRFLQRATLRLFIVYRVVLGLIVLALALSGRAN
jgi:undecaprenyl-diphosphatase